MRRKAQDPGLLLEKEASRKEMSRRKQKAFAEVLGVSTRTVEAWETGRSTPSPTARNLMYLISQQPDLINVLQNARQ